MLVRRGTAAQHSQRFRAGVGDLMDQPRGNRDRIADGHVLELVADLHPSLAMGDVVDLFRFRVMVGRGASARWKSRFGQALLLDARVAMGQQLADFGAILSGERGSVVQIDDIHALFAFRDELGDLQGVLAEGVSL